jgi:hypothetical protein
MPTTSPKTDATALEASPRKSAADVTSEGESAAKDADNTVVTKREPSISPSKRDSELAPTSDVKSEVLSVSVYSQNTAQDKESEPSLLNGQAGQEINGDVAKNKEGGEVYIGSVTWEERTWKELVKLREDMFWARIGGLR